MESWQRLRGAIVNAAVEDACRPIVDWLRAALTRSGPDAPSTLVVPDPLATLPDALLLEHRHRLLLGHLPSLDPSINRAAGTHIAETVGEVAVELRETRLENKRVREGKEQRARRNTSGRTSPTCSTWCKSPTPKTTPPSGRP